MEPLTPDDIEQMKPRKGALVLLIPIFLVFAVLLLYVVTWVVAIQGRAPNGERVTLTWRACAEAQSVIAARVDAMGLGDPVFQEAPDGFSLTATLPGDPETATSIPGTLSERGLLLAKAGDRVVFDHTHVERAAIRQDLTLIPWTVLYVDEAGVKALSEAVLADRDGEIVYELDGYPIARVSNLKGWGPQVEFTAEDATTDLERMRKTAARTIVIGSEPLPCPVVLL